MKIDDIKSKAKDELNELIADSKKQMFEIRFKRAANKYDNSADLGRACSQIKELRKTIARAKTVLAQSEKTAGEVK